MAKKCFAIKVNDSLSQKEQKALFDAIFTNWSDVASFNGSTQFYVYADKGPIEYKDGVKVLEAADILYMIKPYGYWGEQE